MGIAVVTGAGLIIIEGGNVYAICLLSKMYYLC
jgi:hypothetical protein